MYFNCVGENVGWKIPLENFGQFVIHFIGAMDSWKKVILRKLPIVFQGIPIELNKNATDENLESKAIRSL